MRAYAVLAFVLSLPGPAFADLKTNTEFHTTTRLVVKEMANGNIKGLPIDDAISKKALSFFLDAVDPKRIYFFDVDIVEFKKYETKLDDEVLNGQLDFPSLFYARFKIRSRMHFELVKELLKEPFDFSKQETISTDHKGRKHLVSLAEMKARTRQDIKAELLDLKLSTQGLSIDQIKRDLLASYENEAAQNENIDEAEQLETYLSSIGQAFDPHSSYQSPQSREHFNASMSLNRVGIGAQIHEASDGNITVQDILAESPAAIEGTLKKGDTIVAVSKDGTPGDLKVVKGLRIQSVVERISGTSGSKVLLRVSRTANAPTFDLVLTRGAVNIPDSRAKGEVKIVTREGKRYRIGQIYLPQFYYDYGGCAVNPNTCTSANNDVQNILRREDFEKIDLLLLDLRRNGGGSKLAVELLTNLLTGKGPIVQVKTRTEVLAYGMDDAAIYTGPLAVVVNHASASASEILAACIQDRERGLVIGSTTFGKGTVQTVSPVDPRGPVPRGAVYLTKEEFFRITGESTQERGVIPDVLLPSLNTAVIARESSFPNYFPYSTTDAAEYDKLGLVTPEIVSKLKTQSEDRLKLSDGFKRLANLIERYETEKSSKLLSLNEATRVVELKSKMERKASQDSIPLVKRASARAEEDPANFYNQEILNIGIDYLNELKNIPAPKPF